jgi:non-heme chloroperoxidase
MPLKKEHANTVPPLMLKTAANLGGAPIEAFDQIRGAVLADRTQFFKDISPPFYGHNFLDVCGK